MKYENIIMTLLKILLAFYKYLITILEMTSVKYVTTQLMHKMLQRKETKPQCKDVTMLIHQHKGGNSFHSKA